jgi:transposase
MVPVVGIDVGKSKLAVVLVTSVGKRVHKAMVNSPGGHQELLQWLRRHAPGPLPVGLEATGGYQEAVALTLHDAGHRVSVLNPSAVEAFGRSQLRRAKTDPVDADLIADFMRAHTPEAWVPAPPETRQLQALVRRLDALIDMQVQERNRLELAAAIVRPSLQKSVKHLAAQIQAIRRQIRDHIDQFPTLRSQRDLIVSIPGIGATTAAIVLGELQGLHRFRSARQLAAFTGLVPHIRSSGTSVRGRGALSKLGSARLRRALYLPALAAMRHNGPLQVFATRLRAAGKPKMVIVAAVMRKLVHQVFGVLHSQRPFDPRRA